MGRANDQPIMNRRGFFRSVAALVGAASVSPAIFIPKFESVHWKPPQRALARDLRDFYGVWQFVTYKQGPNGIWVQDLEAMIPVKHKSVRVEVRMDAITFTDVQLS